MKAYIIIFVLAMSFPVFAFAASTDVNLRSSTIITVGGYNLVVSGTANFDSITVSSDSFTIDLSSGSTIAVTSADRRSFTVSPTTFKSFTCGSSESTLTLTNNNESKTTVTVTPSASACSVEGGGGAGGGGGGGGYSAPVIPVQTAAIASIVTAPVVPATFSTIAVSVSPVFTKALSVGTTNSDVKRLQQLLNSNLDTQISSSGAGSPGNETTYFGPATKAALQKFQKKYNLAKEGESGYGNFGPKTKAKLQEVFKQTAPVVPETTTLSTPVTVSVSPVFTKVLSVDMTSSDVKRLQQILNSDPETQISSSGAGSPGSETTYFGSATKKAVQKFQVKYGIAKEGEAGYGNLGPKTRAKIQEVFKQ